MDDKKAIQLLTEMLTKHPLSSEEKEAVREAIGMLAWSKLIEGRVKSMKRSRDKRLSDG